MMENHKIILPLRVQEETTLLRSSSIAGQPLSRLGEAAALSSFPVQSDNIINSPRDLLAILKAKPSFEDLERCLAYIDQAHEDETSSTRFHIKLLGPTASQVVYLLVNVTVPSYWSVLSTSKHLRGQWRSLVRSLKSVAGIGAVSTRVKALCRSSEEGKQETIGQVETGDDQLKIALQLLECLLQGDRTIDAIWKDTKELERGELRWTMVMDQLTSFLAGGSILSSAAEAARKLREASREVSEIPWVGDGEQYATWLGRNIYAWSQTIVLDDDVIGRKARDRLLSRSLSLGYTDRIVGAIFNDLIEGKSDDLSLCKSTLASLTEGSQSTVLSAVLKILTERAAKSDASKYVGGAAALLHSLVVDENRVQRYLAKWLNDLSGPGLSADIKLFRAVITAIGDYLGLLKQIHTDCLRRFGSKHYIKHDPILQQEKQAQVLLLVTGKLFKTDPEYVKKMKHTSDYLNAISNRLAASSTRAQFLGMAVGMAVSSLVDEGDKKLTFSGEEVEGDDGQMLLSLTSLNDTIGSITDLTGLQVKELPQRDTNVQPRRSEETVPPVKKKPELGSKVMVIEEVTDSDESEDDLPMYAKPDSDAEDSEDDPTLINRNKPTAPVYIRDLLAGLRDDENYDRHKLAIETAPGLIRRKSRFGTEVTEHVEELAGTIIGLKDNFDLERTSALRLQSLVALVLAAPAQMGPWFANTFFNGDYSMSQRASILTTLALAARELAGLKDEDISMTGANDAPSFPSKRLPGNSEAFYLSAPSSAAPTPITPVTRLSGRLEREILQPLALSAADAATGPNVLKVRTFSSRLDPAKQAARTRTIPNQLAKLVSTAFFFPLTSRWRAVLGVRSGNGRGSIFGTPFILSQFVRTLALILSAAGPGTLSLPGMTTEFWALLLALRGQVVGEIAAVEALLLGFLTLLELNIDRARDIVQEHADDVGATTQWAQTILENMRGGAKEEERVRVLAAGVLVKAEEIMERYRKELLGGVGKLL